MDMTLQLTSSAEQSAPALVFTVPADRGYAGVQAISADYQRIYHVVNVGCGRSDEFGLRVNSTWLPFHGSQEQMFALAQAIEAQNDETRFPD